MKATCIVVDGPESVQDGHGDERARYSVFKADDDGEPVGTIDHYPTYFLAVQRGQELAALNPGLELVIDASRG